MRTMLAAMLLFMCACADSLRPKVYDDIEDELRVRRARKEHESPEEKAAAAKEAADIRRKVGLSGEGSSGDAGAAAPAAAGDDSDGDGVPDHADRCPKDDGKGDASGCHVN